MNHEIRWNQKKLVRPLLTCRIQAYAMWLTLRAAFSQHKECKQALPASGALPTCAFSV